MREEEEEEVGMRTMTRRMPDCPEGGWGFWGVFA